MPGSFDFATLWAQGDVLARSVMVLLLTLSVGSWTIIVLKAVQIALLRMHGAAGVDRFWRAPNVDAGLQELAKAPLFGDLAARGVQAVQHYSAHGGKSTHLDSDLSASELVTRALRQGINRASSQLESGQTFLASVGSLSPFVGLLGTVWGIYHALAKIGETGQASLDKVAGPVGEALIMTAVGLFVAIPAVLAYNAFNRQLRIIAADLDAFAHDLLTYFTTGRPIAATPLRQQQPVVPAAAVQPEAA